MARGPFSPTNNFASSTPITAYPFTFAAWVQSSDITTGNEIVVLTELPSGDSHQLIQAIGGTVRVSSVDFTVGSGTANSTASMSNNTWSHACGVFSAANSRSAYLNGGNKETDTNNINANMAGMDEIEIGFFRAVGSDRNLDIAEVGIWDVALSDEEVAALGHGYSCHLIRPQNLIHHMPLMRGSQDFKGDLSENGTVNVASHPPILGAIAA